MSSTTHNWNNLFRLAGAAAIIMLVYSLVTMLLLIMVGGQPETALEGFTMVQENRLVGLLRLDLLTILVMPLYYLLFLGLYVALKNTRKSCAAVFLVFGCAGVTLFLATPSVISWMTLSDKYAAATNDAQKNLLLAAGEAILAADMWHSTGAMMGGLITGMGFLLASVAMLGTNVFGKLTAWMGVVTHGLDLLHILVGFFLPAGGVALMMVAGPLYLVWFPLLARDFFRLGKNDSNES
jgi:hypothetical protein